MELEPELRKLSRYKAKKVEWLLDSFIPNAMLTLLEGNPGVGKSFLAMDLAARISSGKSLPDGSKLKPEAVVYLSTEDDPEHTIRPRIDEMGGDAEKVIVQHTWMDLGEKGLEVLEDTLLETEPRLLVLDPLFGYIPGRVDMFKPNEIRPFLFRLKTLAEDYEMAILGVRHLTKQKHDNAIYQGGGSIDVIGAARSALRVAPHPEEPDQRLLVQVKHNIAPRVDSLVFTLKQTRKQITPVVEWLGTSELSIDDLMHVGQPIKTSLVDDAVTFLKNYLADGPKKAKDVEAAAEARSISSRTLTRARKKAQVVTKKNGKSNYLSLP